jgi:prepilin-type N-terminal cleavage/methylation domain-containing protein
LFLKNICNKSGYTFIELLVAIAILGLVVTPLLTLFTTGYFLISNARQQTIALNLCRSKLEEVKSPGYYSTQDLQFNAFGSPIIEFDPEGFSGYRRETFFSAYALPTDSNDPPLLELVQVDVAVFWPVQSGEQSETLSYLLGKH